MLELFFFSLSLPLFVEFLYFCYSDDEIFNGYWKFLVKYVEPNFPNLFKILGGCVYCHGTWVCILLFVFFQFIYGWSFLWLLLCLGVNYFVLKKINH